MRLTTIAGLIAAGYAGYRFLANGGHSGRAAFADGQGSASGFSQVRDAGPQAMRDPPAREWTKVDEYSDESFPASDPPATY